MLELQFHIFNKIGEKSLIEKEQNRYLNISPGKVDFETNKMETLDG